MLKRRINSKTFEFIRFKKPQYEVKWNAAIDSVLIKAIRVQRNELKIISHLTQLLILHHHLSNMDVSNCWMTLVLLGVLGAVLLRGEDMEEVKLFF